MDDRSYLSNAHPEYIESLYREYKKDPSSVDLSWQRFFEGYDLAARKNGTVADGDDPNRRKEVDVVNLINAYRTRGHLFTKTNPVRERRQYTSSLEHEHFGLTDDDLDTVFEAGSQIGIGPAPLREIIQHLKETYCYSIGAEFMYIRQPDRNKWLVDKMESRKNRPQFTKEERLYILKWLYQAVAFENFLHTKYVGQKRFALSGGETLIPALHGIIEKGSQIGVKEFVIGMAHRGRLNVLANVMGKSYTDMFAEFEGVQWADEAYEGDVKYHLGASSNIVTELGQQIHLNLVPNPSHLDAVDSVVEGVVRAKIDKRYEGDHSKIAPILIHGDAAVAGQGVVYEVIQMSLLEGYKTGGTIHLVINNQIGFTTNYLDARSSTYCTDVGKVTHSPVFHVNADDVESVILALLIAMEYRQTFHTDVFIDLLGYRKYGHNESDEPRFTQPKLYKQIMKHPNVYEIYKNNLLKGEIITQDEVAELEASFQKILQDSLEEAKSRQTAAPISSFQKDWRGFRRPDKEDFELSPETGVPARRLNRVADKLFTIPPELNVIPKIRRVYDDRVKRYSSGENFDWAMGEALAFGTLLDEGIPIRLSGQDCERGTFSHRHAVLLQEDTEEEYVPLRNISEKQEDFQVYNSLLSEYAVLGFEYGYALANPNGLTIWEAQFGDFANGAQIIIDQYIASSETKWKRYAGLVMLLPHGFEGQGPEHSSARIERFLSLCAQNNMEVVNCTTPANLFHVLRRQTKYDFRIPLVIFTPKSLLRHPLCVSPRSEFTKGRFQEVIDDPTGDPKKVKRILFCSGKIYYDLLERQSADNREDIAIVRLEQLHPLPVKQVLAVIEKYSEVERYFWVQEEPENMGPWSYLRRNFKLVRTTLISRDASPSPATGFFKQHLIEQKEIIDLAFNELTQASKKIVMKEV